MTEFYRKYVFADLKPVTGFEEIYGYVPRVAVIDDSEGGLYLTGNLLNRAGMIPVGFEVNGEYHPNSFEVRGFLESLNPNKIHAAVSDKSLGYFNAIEFIKRMREDRGIPNLMFTGEPGTRETHRVATRYLEKLIEYEDVYLLINVMLLLNLSDDVIVRAFARAREGNDKLLPKRSMIGIPQIDRQGHITGYDYEYYPEGDKEEVGRYNQAILSFSEHDLRGLLLQA